MKKNKIIIFSIILLLLVNTSYFWSNLPELFDVLIALILVLCFVILLLILVYQFAKGLTEKFKIKKRNQVIVVTLSVLTIIYLFPFGFINFEKIIYGEDIFFAQYEGVANGTISLKLKKNNRFIEKSIFLGIDNKHGNYKIKNDTLFLEFEKKSTFNQKISFVLQEKTNRYNVIYYSRGINEKPLPMKILKGSFQELE